MTFLNEICIRYPDAISFAPGRPLEEGFDSTLIDTYTQRFIAYLKEEKGMDEERVARELLQYGNTSGIIAPFICEHLKKDEGIVVEASDIVVTVGAQEGMLLALRALCAAPVDAVLVPEPCYVGIVGAAKLLNIPIVPVPETNGTIDPHVLSATISRAQSEGLNPVLLYLVPSYANPSGVSLSVQARQQLLAFASDVGLLILEDNPYGLFARAPYEPVATIKSMDEQGRVIYLGSFSKTGFPGARIGYVVAEQSTHSGLKLAEAFSAIKSMITVNTPPIAQAVIGGMLLSAGCSLKSRNQAAVARYSENLTELLASLTRVFGDVDAVSWNEPEGGFFTVLEVPFNADDHALARCAQNHGVLWTPMQHFYVGGSGGERALRLSSSLLSVERIREGIDRLGAFIREECRST